MVQKKNMIPFIITCAVCLIFNTNAAFSQEHLTDTTAPVIEGAEDGKIYCKEQMFRVIDMDLAEVTINNIPITLTEDGVFSVSPSSEIQTIKAIDKAGNATSIDIVVNSEHIYVDNTCIVCGQDFLQNILMASSNTELVFGKQIDRDTIKTVELMNTLSSADTSTWDVSRDKDGSVLAWITTDSNGWNHLYLAANGIIAANENCAALFKDYSNLEEIQGLEYFNTHNTTNMYSMFYGCTNLKKLNLNSFDTSNVTDMSYMFRECTSLQELNVDHFDTSNVTNMDNMFRECTSLHKLNVDNFKTNAVTNMRSVFNSCMNLQELNLDNFDTRNVINMSYMFYDCTNLQSLKLDNFNTSKVIEMQSMFYNCNHLQELNLDNFDTRNVMDMSHMFANCLSLKTLNLSSFNTDKVTNMNYAFDNCPNLKELNLENR